MDRFVLDSILTNDFQDITGFNTLNWYTPDAAVEKISRILPVLAPNLDENDADIEEMISQSKALNDLIGKEVYIPSGQYKASFGVIRAISLSTVTIRLEKTTSTSKTDVTLPLNVVILL